MRKRYLRIVAALAITAALLIPAFIFTGAALAAPLSSGIIAAELVDRYEKD